MSITLDGTSGITSPTYAGTVTAEYSVPVTAFKNRIINGAMGIWQRGTSGFTTSGNYSADRFAAQTGGTLTAVAQSTDVPNGFKYSLSVAGTNQPAIFQRIESANCTDLVGQSITIQFQAKQSVGAGTNTLAIALYHANTSDNFSGLTQIGSTQFFNGSASWSTFSTTFSSLPTGAANGLHVLIISVVTGSSTTLFTGVQLEKGSTATSFDYRPYGQELALCQRYYVKMATNSSGVYAAFGSGLYINATTGYVYTKYPVSMRASPTASSSQLALTDGNTNQAVSSISGINCGYDSALLTIAIASGGTQYRPNLLIANNNAAGYLDFTAEL